MRFILTLVSALLASAVVRLGCAEVLARTDSPGAIAHAAELEGRLNAARLMDLAGAADVNGDSRALLRQALAANPRDVSAWSALGLAAERAGDFAAAEHALLQAARLDRRYLPAWTLANYYFRRGERDPFWMWARRAARMAYDDFPPLFRLGDVFEPDAARVLDRLGGDARMTGAYVTYLAGEAHRLDAAELAARRLLALPAAGDRPIVMNLITREIAANRMRPALELWNAVFTPLDPSRGPVLTNGVFNEKPSGEGFDWRMPTCEGAVSQWRPGRLFFDLTGRQSDVAILLERPIPTVRGRRYRLHFESVSPSTPRWEWDGLPSADDSFSATRDALVQLRLVCRRTPGAVPFEGRIEIRNLSIEVE